MSCFLSTVNTACNLDFILSYLGSGSLWSINVWEPDSTTSSAEFLSRGVGQILLLSSVEFLSRGWRSGVWREGERGVQSGVYYSPAFRQVSRLIWVLVFGTVNWCKAQLRYGPSCDTGLQSCVIVWLNQQSWVFKSLLLFSLNWPFHIRIVLSSGGIRTLVRYGPEAWYRNWEFHIRTGASWPDTDPRAIRTGRLVGQYSNSSRVSRLLQAQEREPKKLKTS